MLKKITSSELVLGLHVERLARSWPAPPFWTRSFLLESSADLERMRTARHCDVYDAITSTRPYKKGWCPAESLRRMAAWRGGHLDATLFSAFVKCLGIYPLGTLVRLPSERLAVVVGQVAGKTLTSPTVRTFFSIRANTCIAPCVIDLVAPGCQERLVSTESADQWGLLDVDRYWAGEPAVA